MSKSMIKFGDNLFAANPCHSIPCQNQGKCNPSRGNEFHNTLCHPDRIPCDERNARKFECKCPPGYVGQVCEKSKLTTINYTLFSTPTNKSAPFSPLTYGMINTYHACVQVECMTMVWSPKPLSPAVAKPTSVQLTFQTVKVITPSTSTD